MPEFGMAPKHREECDHRGQWTVANAGGFAIQYCEGCGESRLLYHFGDETYALIELPVYVTEMWEEIAKAKESGEEAVEVEVEEEAEDAESVQLPDVA